MSNVADEAFGNVRTVKAFANEIEETEKFDKHNVEVFNVGRQRCIWQGLFVVAIQILFYGAFCMIIFVAGKLYE